MRATRFPLVIAASLATTFSTSLIAQALPADCSKATVPDQPVAVSIAGTKFTPKVVKLRDAGGMTYGETPYDTYRLALRSEDELSPPLEAEFVVLVKKGQPVDGRTFRKLVIKDTGKQPAPTPGLPEVQGWSLKNRAGHVDFSHVTYLASLRIDFARRQGDTIGGKIYLCVPKGQTTIFDKTPSKEDSSVVGTFTARIEK